MQAVDRTHGKDSKQPAARGYDAQYVYNIPMTSSAVVCAASASVRQSSQAHLEQSSDRVRKDLLLLPIKSRINV